MNLKAKPYVEAQKNKIQADLAARVALLKERGIDGKGMEKDPRVRKLKADIRQANTRLSSIAAAEERNARVAQSTKEKASAGKQPKAAKKVEEKPVKKEKKKKEKKQAEA